MAGVVIEMVQSDGSVEPRVDIPTVPDSTIVSLIEAVER